MTANILNEDDLLAVLPDSLAEMAEVISATDVWKLAERFGGTRLFFPLHPDETSGLASVLGLPAAQAICARYGGEVFDVPCAKRAQREMRNREIVALRAQGKSVGWLALRFETTMRNISRILSEARRAALR